MTNTMFVKNFINSLKLPKIANDLLQSKADCMDFFKNYYRKNHHVIFDLLDYKEMKLNASKITLEDFKNHFNQSPREALTETFKQEFGKEEVGLIEERLKDGAITLDSIYSEFMVNSNQNVMKMVLGESK
ncbi:hypothetical protein P4637_19530 [Halalkalibacterium halodurans]|uniref:BH2348 protein n=2 Tax=Halalkalibacterium halodurans TaxID=86665 RepID=Q9KAE1_HALH5|nr:hypothetical protein [Halalkalibacterium halodurans]MDY7222896.1 hypothetical protein [Halalkalibacterium halodurans]MDY7242117.1 hypothetical protein [Halalkalibacterium halodurans]MED4081176.1 hypothetical protein [Halalkalibacterium halodurans]MED4087011.1 hypothetical protein [Halalkalibacterium halodurans]MED4103177.1 hypothetical protein [Halalkalibacterium halodurans]